MDVLVVPTIAFIVTIILLVYILVLHGGTFAKINLPGPFGLPVVGNAFQLDRRRPWETLESWARIYGDAYLIRLFSVPVVVLAGPATIRAALVDRGRDFAGRPRPFFRAGFMADQYQDVVSGSPGPVWTTLRRAVQRAMKTAGDLGPNGEPSSATSPSTSNTATRGRTERLTATIIGEMCDEFAESGGLPIDPRPAVYHAVMNMTCLMLIGDRFRRDDEELAMYKRLERLVTTSMSVGGQGSELDVFPWLRHFGNATYRKLVEAKCLRDVLYERVRARVFDPATGSVTRRGVVHALFDSLADDRRRQRSSGVITENHVKLAIVNLLVGGAAATTGYIYASLNILAHYPEVQDEIRAEVDRTVAGWTSNAERSTRTTRWIGLDDKASMPYTSAAVIELLRYASLSPILIPHRTLTETSIGDVRIPADVTVFLHVRAVHHDESFWTDPFRYRPERFLERVAADDVDEGGLASYRPSDNEQKQTGNGMISGGRWRLVPADDERRRRVMSFGAGPRSCPGEAIALTRLFLAVANVVRRYVIKPEAETGDDDDDCQQTPCDPRTFDPGLVLSPKDFRVRFVSRDRFGEPASVAC